MPTLHDLLERVDRLVLRHEELRRTQALMEQQLQAAHQERDHLRTRLTAARGRIDALLARLPAEPLPGGQPVVTPPEPTTDVAQRPGSAPAPGQPPP